MQHPFCVLLEYIRYLKFVIFYRKFINCSMCRFATSCSIAYANHMMGFHSGQMSSLNLNIPWERPMSRPMYCLCGFTSKYGNKIGECIRTVPDKKIWGKHYIFVGVVGVG